MRQRRRRLATGFTMVEATLCVVIVGVLLVASTRTFGSLAQARRLRLESRLANMLAQQLLTEAEQVPFQNAPTNPTFGPTPGQLRATFAAVDAYNGYTASPPTDHSGTALAGYNGWTEAAAVAFVDPANPNTVVSTSNLKRVIVTVTAPSRKTYALVGLRSAFGAYELQPTSLTNYVTGVSVAVQGASPATAVDTGAHPLNISSSQ